MRHLTTLTAWWRGVLLRARSTIGSLFHRKDRAAAPPDARPRQPDDHHPDLIYPLW
jgi:hypothetical protein